MIICALQSIHQWVTIYQFLGTSKELDDRRRPMRVKKGLFSTHSVHASAKFSVPSSSAVKSSVFDPQVNEICPRINYQRPTTSKPLTIGKQIVKQERKKDGNLNFVMEPNNGIVIFWNGLNSNSIGLQFEWNFSSIHPTR